MHSTTFLDQTQHAYRFFSRNLPHINYLALIRVLLKKSDIQLELFLYYSIKATQGTVQDEKTEHRLLLTGKGQKLSCPEPQWFKKVNKMSVGYIYHTIHCSLSNTCVIIPNVILCLWSLEKDHTEETILKKSQIILNSDFQREIKAFCLFSTRHNWCLISSYFVTLVLMTKTQK